MCIYLGQRDELTYETQEHVLPAALGCLTKLEKGIVSDQANKLFSPIERDIIQNSLILLPRTIMGPGKRGSLAVKDATTSKLSCVKVNEKNGLGYMKGDQGFQVSHFVISPNDEIGFSFTPDDNINAQDEIQKLKEKIAIMGDKYVPIEMPSEDEKIYIAYFKNKIHIGYSSSLSNERVAEIREIFRKNFSQAKQSIAEGQISMTLKVEHNVKNLCIIAAKSAVNTLAYLKGDKYIIQNNCFYNIIKQILSESEDIFQSVVGIDFKIVETIRQRLYIANDQLACILLEERRKLKAIVFFYEHCFEVLLSDDPKITHNILMNGIVCDWKNRKDYLYLDFLKKEGVLY